MHRVGDAEGAVQGKYAAGDGQRASGTQITAEALTSFQDEIANAITGYGIALEKGNNEQLANILQGSMITHIQGIAYPSSTIVYETNEEQAASDYPLGGSLEKIGNPKFALVIAYGGGGGASGGSTTGINTYYRGSGGSARPNTGLVPLTPRGLNPNGISFMVGSRGASSTSSDASDAAGEFGRDSTCTHRRGTIRGQGGDPGVFVNGGSGSSFGIFDSRIERQQFGEGGQARSDGSMNGKSGGFEVFYFFTGRL